jgi:predicted PolB exonuclease-like 3'-5' exonuclease
MTYTYLDIETLPSQSPDLLAKLRAEIKPPATFKKPESIAEWMRENADAAAADALAKTSFDPGYGHVCAIAWAVDDGPIVSHHAETVGQERGILADFFSSIDPYHSTTFVGHYINGFDLRFLLCRAVVLGVKIPRAIPRDPKPWDQKLADTMTMWAGARGSIGMDKLADILGIPGKNGFDGSMVAQAWADGRHAEIAEYCRDDVRITREIHRRFLAADW